MIIEYILGIVLIVELALVIQDVFDFIKEYINKKERRR